MAALSPVPKLQFFDANGEPLVGGKLYSYAAGTTTPQATYTDAGGVTANPNPVILDGRGEASVWLSTPLYKLKLATSTDVEVWTVDNVGGNVTLSDLAASNGSSLVGFLQQGTNAVARTVQSKLRDHYSVKDFGAVGDNVADDTIPIQRAISQAMLTGGTVFFPRGRYYITAPLVLDYSSNTIDPVNGGLTRVTLEGDGPGASQIRSQHAGVCIDYRGGPAFTDGVHAFFYVRNLGLFNGFRNTGSVGIKTNNCAFWEFSDLDVFGFEYGLLLLDTLTGVANRIRLWSHKYGFYSEFIDFSRPNAITFNNVAVASCRVYAGLVNGPSEFRICGGSIEGNGVDLPSGTPDADPIRVGYWGVKVVNAGDEGKVGLVLDGVYLEGNRGYADVWIEQNANTVAHSIQACSFARIFANDYTNYNILYSGTSTTTRVNLTGNGFGALNTYVETSLRPYVISATRAVFMEGGGNVYQTSSSLDRSVFTPVRYSIVSKAIIAADPMLDPTGTNFGTMLYVTDGAVGSNPALAVSDGTIWRYSGLSVNGSTVQTVGTLMAGAHLRLGSFTVTGAQLGDFVDVSASINLFGVNLFGYVSAADSVQLVWENGSGSSVTLGSATYYIRCTRPGT
jgi:hypothetical protein